MEDRPKVLVTGATGRVGALLRAAWERRPPAFRPVWQTRRAGAPPGWVTWHMLREPYPARAVAPDVILHLAAPTPASGGDPDDTQRLAEAALAAASATGARHLFIASSAAVHGAPLAPLLSETAEPTPRTPYGRSKAAMERGALACTGTPLTILRIGNIPGADALLGGARPGAAVLLDPVPGRPGGPVRSWIGPQVLADVLSRLVMQAALGRTLPRVLNVAQPTPLPMAELLDAAGIDWSYGPDCTAAPARVGLCCDLLAGLVRPVLPPATATGLVGDWRGLVPTAA